MTEESTFLEFWKTKIDIYAAHMNANKKAVHLVWSPEAIIVQFYEENHTDVVAQISAVSFFKGL